METTAAATPTSLTGSQMPVRVAGSCGCARVAEIFSAKVVQHICVSEDPAKFQQVVRMLEQKATVAKVSLVPFVVSALLCACPSARPPCPLPPLSLPVRMFWPTPTPSPIIIIVGKYYGGVYRINKRKKEFLFLKRCVETIYVTNSSTMQN